MQKSTALNLSHYQPLAFEIDAALLSRHALHVPLVRLPSAPTTGTVS